METSKNKDENIIGDDKKPRNSNWTLEIHDVYIYNAKKCSREKGLQKKK